MNTTAIESTNALANLSQVHEEVLKAYADGDPSCMPPRALQTRDLDFRSSHWIERDQAVDLMCLVVPHGYNEFSGTLLAMLPKTCHIQIARNGSVCMYIDRRVGRPLADRMKADEYNYEPSKTGKGGISRLWWD